MFMRILITPFVKKKKSIKVAGGRMDNSNPEKKNADFAWLLNGTFKIV